MGHMLCYSKIRRNGQGCCNMQWTVGGSKGDFRMSRMMLTAGNAFVGSLVTLFMFAGADLFTMPIWLILMIWGVSTSVLMCFSRLRVQ